MQPPSSVWLNYVSVYDGVIWRESLPGRTFVTLNLYVADCPETLVSVYYPTWCQNPESSKIPNVDTCLQNNVISSLWYLTSWSIWLQKFIVSQRVNKSPAFSANQQLITACHRSSVWVKLVREHIFYHISLNQICYSPLCQYLLSHLFLSIVLSKTRHVISLFSIRAACTAHLTLLPAFLISFPRIPLFWLWQVLLSHVIYPANKKEEWGEWGV